MLPAVARLPKDAAAAISASLEPGVLAVQDWDVIYLKYTSLITTTPRKAEQNNSLIRTGDSICHSIYSVYTPEQVYSPERGE